MLPSSQQAPSYEGIRRSFQDRFHIAAKERSLPSFHEECLESLSNPSCDEQIPYSFAYAARALLHNHQLWQWPECKPSSELIGRLDCLLQNKRAINCRDNYYYPIMDGLRFFILDDVKRSYARLAEAARLHDFYRVVKDDLGGGASFAKVFPDDQVLSASAGRLQSRPKFHVIASQGRRVTYSISCDPVYAVAFARTWIADITKLGSTDIGLHLHIIFRSNEDTNFLADLLNSSIKIKDRFSLSSETTGGAFDRAYFASARFLHGVYFQSVIRAPLWFVDADARIAHDSSAALKISAEANSSLGLISRGPYNGYLPWRSFSAGWLFIPYNEAGTKFMATTAACLKYLWDDRPGRNWWIDQMALETASRIIKYNDPEYAPQSVASKIQNPFTTGESYKIECISKHPEISRKMSLGTSYHQALREVAESY